MKNLLLFAVFGGYTRLCRANSNVFRSFLQCKRFPLNYFTHKVEETRKNEVETQKFGRCVPNTRTNIMFGIRKFSSEAEQKKTKLMEFNWIVWPSIIKTFKNWIFTALIIQPYFDNEFSLPDFVKGSRQVLEVVSARVSSGEFSKLQDLVTEDCLEEVQKNIHGLNVAQRQDLAINNEDIYFSFPYEVGIMFDDPMGSEGKQQKRSVEITMVYHVLRGYRDMLERGEVIPINIGLLPEFKDRISICNYRFIRNYTKGVSDQWTINIINHFKPAEYVES